LIINDNLYMSRKCTWGDLQMIMLDGYASFISCFLGLGFYFTENTVCLITKTKNGKGLSEM
jgi:hypothetical protein